MAGKLITEPEFFYDGRNGMLWTLITEMPVESVNLVSLMGKLKDAGRLEAIGGLPYLNSCIEGAIGPSFLTTWLQETQDKYTARKLVFKCSEIISKVHRSNSPIIETLDMAEKDILAIRPRDNREVHVKDLVRSALDKIELKCEKGDTITGLSTGLSDLDRLTDGLHGGEVIVVAAYPSCGKTALAVNIAVHNALKGVPVAIFSAEMLPAQLMVRSICSESKVNFHRATFNDAPKLVVPASRLANAPLFIEQASGMSIGQVTAVARRLKQKHGIRLIVIDYLQLLSGKGETREQEISSISKGIKAMSLELDCPVLALSQLTDDGKLRESRAIGQDADSIWKLNNDGDWQPAIQPIKLVVEKCRDGATGSVNLTFLKEYTRFESVAKVYDTE